MAWTAPATWTAAVVTAAQLNEQICDNLNYLKTAFDYTDLQVGTKVYHNADQAFASGSFLTIAFNSEVFDDAAMHDTVTNNSRLTCTNAGKYLVVANIRFDPVNPSGKYVSLALFKGATQYETYTKMYNAIMSKTGLSIVTMHDLSVGDYMELKIKHNQAGNVTVKYVANQYSFFSAQKLG